jgi:hypothetical protein
VSYSKYEAGSPKGTPASAEFDIIVGADGANSRTAKAIDAGEYNYAIAFQERIKIADDKMKYYEDLAEMYVGDDVSPDFYAWVFPKYDHVGVGTGTVVNRPAISEYQASRARGGQADGGTPPCTRSRPRSKATNLEHLGCCGRRAARPTTRRAPYAGPRSPLRRPRGPRGLLRPGSASGAPRNSGQTPR